jgi:hypothetical protein
LTSWHKLSRTLGQLGQVEDNSKMASGVVAVITVGSYSGIEKLQGDALSIDAHHLGTHRGRFAITQGLLDADDENTADRRQLFGATFEEYAGITDIASVHGQFIRATFHLNFQSNAQSMIATFIRHYVNRSCSGFQVRD